MRVAKAIVLTDEERVTLTKWARGRSTPARLTLAVVEVPRQRHVNIQVHGRQTGKRVVLRAATTLPAFTTTRAD